MKIGAYINKVISFTLFASAVLLFLSWVQAAEKDAKVPFQLGLGKNLYETNCSSCHGVDANGTKSGPPFIHKIYEPSHHGDAAFYRAALNGVKAHHWRFGNMPPVQDLTQKDVSNILPYVRWLQRQGGIH